LKHASSVFPRLTVLNITAKQETLTQRLAARGRETKEEMSRRLSESAKPLPDGLKVLQLTNDGPLSETIARAAMLLQPASV
jgi:ribose 1,5-bisphosphokinase